MSKYLDVTHSEELKLTARGYSIIKKLGEGTYANVYLTEYTSLKDTRRLSLACKIMDTSKMSIEFVEKFLPRELDIISQISHPHIIQIQNIFQRKTKYFIFMRYAENGDMLEFILKKGALSEAQARVWFRQISLAIQYLHEMDIAHRDLKCENIFITANFNIKIADFGFARYSTNSDGNLITSDTFCGSLSYASPEILRGIPYYPKLADMWSAGVILYIMLNKAMPFDDNNVRRLYAQQINSRWKFRTRYANIISDQCKQLVQHMLEPDIEKRWTANQIANCEWILMDERLAKLTQSEADALNIAKEHRKQPVLTTIKMSVDHEKTQRTSITSKTSAGSALPDNLTSTSKG